MRASGEQMHVAPMYKALDAYTAVLADFHERHVMHEARKSFSADWIMEMRNG
jgi:hypothetical protein